MKLKLTCICLILWRLLLFLRVLFLFQTLPEKKITVAGVRERVYKHSVYSIKHPKAKKHVYVCAEFATPLKTFKEVFTNATAHTGNLF